MPAEDDEPSFAIPRRPSRRFPRRGGVVYEGATVFSLTPDSIPARVGNGQSDTDGEEGGGEADADDDGLDDDALASLVESVLESGPYRYGDWFDLPMPLYLVHDAETHDTFRVAVRDGAVELHVRPETEPSGLRALYERLSTASGVDWKVACRTE